jgi:hypothetical protein
LLLLLKTLQSDLQIVKLMYIAPDYLLVPGVDGVFPPAMPNACPLDDVLTFWFEVTLVRRGANYLSPLPDAYVESAIPRPADWSFLLCVDVLCHVSHLRDLLR